jgi:lipoprotein-anchoring transpeptidase ErfK/SrfK
VLAGVGHAQAQERTFFDIFGGGPNFQGGGYGGSSPIQRSTVNFSGNYAPGTIYINTAERRLYLVLGNGQALRYGIGVGRDGFAGAEPTASPRRRNGRAGHRLRRC